MTGTVNNPANAGAAAGQGEKPGARPTMINGFEPSAAGDLNPEVACAIERRDSVLGPGYRLFYQRPVEFVRGAGAHLFTPDGTDYLDAYNNVQSVGHAHPRVAEAVYEQLQRLNVHTRYLQESLVQYAQDLLSTFPDALARASFTCTGSEANDLAFRIARHETGHEGVVVTRTAYHGITDRVSSFSPSLGPRSPLGPNVRLVDAPDALRAARLGVTDLGGEMRRRVSEAIEDLRRHGYGLAAFYADAVFSSDGVYTDPAGFLVPVAEEVRAAGGMYVADEVQAGFGRTGEEWWGFQRHGIVPDLVTLGKPMGNGLPIAGVVLREGLGDKFGADMRYFNTFGGNAVSIAAAHTVLGIIRDEGLMDRAQRIGSRLRAELGTILTSSPHVAEIRGTGQFTGVDLVTDLDTLQPAVSLASRVVNDLSERKVLISATGVGNVLKIRPPLAFNDDDADRFLETFAGLRAVLDA
jgi:4-aminobutyrate aminotransferase-like enzyme